MIRALREEYNGEGKEAFPEMDREDPMEGMAFYLGLAGGQEMMQRDEGEGVHGREQ